MNAANASAGVPEYWIVNLLSRCLEVSHDPVPMAGEPYGYGYQTASQFVVGQTVTPLATPQGVIQVADLPP